MRKLILLIILSLIPISIVDANQTFRGTEMKAVLTNNNKIMVQCKVDSNDKINDCWLVNNSKLADVVIEHFATVQWMKDSVEDIINHRPVREPKK